jgi:nitrogen fixation protein FixH
MSVVACSALVWVATRADSPRPIKGYYEAARAWDTDEAVAEASRGLGWTVRYDVPSDVPHYPGMPRPVDIRIADRDGKPVSGLAGTLFAVRPSDARLNQVGELTELPQEAGSYRTLVRLDQPGAWEFHVEARYPRGNAGGTRAEMRFVDTARVNVRGDDGVPAGRER